MTFADKILTLRKSKGMTQEELAEKLNISRQAISRWEMGTAQPDVENVLQISKLFSVTTDYLIDDSWNAEETVRTENTYAKLNDKKVKCSRWLIIGFVLLLFAIAFLIVSIDRLSIAFVAVSLGCVFAACIFFFLHFKNG